MLSMIQIAAMLGCLSLFAGAVSAQQNVQSLAGSWDFALDPADLGVRDSWSLRDLPDAIRLPGTTDEARKGEPGPEREGVLTRRYEYIGAAWYQRDIVIPEDWAGMEVELFLERVLWQSRVWVDGREVGEPLDSWAAPHVHRLGVLEPGWHRLALRIDNRMIHPLGTWSHSYGHHTQTVWNGVIGQIELRALRAARIAGVRVFPKKVGDEWTVRVEVDLRGEVQSAQLSVRVRDPVAKETVARWGPELVSELDASGIVLSCRSPVLEWSEHSPVLYDLSVDLSEESPPHEFVIGHLDHHDERFGFREITAEGNRLLLNGRPLFLRGNLDCVHFPLTGHPSTDERDWGLIFHHYREHGLNHVRFHSWCPPEAAFRVADELGLYVQAEAGIWINEHPDEGRGPGKGDPGVDEYAQAEMRRVVDAFGNHPSFVLFAIGNELGHSDFETTGGWIGALREHDPRRLYAASTARQITPSCQFNATHRVPGIGMVRQRLEQGTDWDYEEQYGRTEVPIIAHEIGQWPVYPDWEQAAKYTGVLRNTRLEALREEARAAGVLGQAADFTAASGALSALLYKDEIESFLRTPSCRGFQLLAMQDFQGQGEAYVGWLDVFWDSKGTTDPAAFRGYCAPVVALARMPKYTFVRSETLEAGLWLRNDGPAALESVRLSCAVLDEEGEPRWRQEIDPLSARRGELVEAGMARVPLASLAAGLRPEQAARFRFELRVEGKEEPNTWPFWVFPDELPPLDVSEVLVADRLDDETLAALRSGASVLLEAHRLGDPDRPVLAGWRPLYWSIVLFPGQRETLGLLVDEGHPALRDFPTGHFNDWQWRPVCAGARGFDLTGRVSAGYRPIAQPVPTFHRSRKIGAIFELRVGAGRLLVCGYDLTPERCRAEPVVRQLRHSLLRYVASPDFEPTQALFPAELRALLPTVEEAEPIAPPDLGGAILRVDASAHLEVTNRLVEYSPELDRARAAPGVHWEISGVKGSWRDQYCSVWVVGAPATLCILTPRAGPAHLYLHLSDWNRNQRRGRIELEGGRSILRIGEHDATLAGAWFRLDLSPEDTADGQLSVEIRCTGGSNIMIEEVALVPVD